MLKYILFFLLFLPVTVYATPDNMNEIASIPGAKYRIILPPDLYFVENGPTINVYFDSLFRESAGLDDFYVDVVCTYGQQLSDRWTFAPTDTLADGATLTINTYFLDGTLIDTASSTLHVAAATASGTVTILYIGDSTVPAKPVELLKAYDTADDNVSFAFIGTQNAPNNSEGHSGVATAWFGNNDASPLRYNGQVDIAHYLSVNGFNAPDFVIWQTGINDTFGRPMSEIQGRSDLMRNQINTMTTYGSSFQASNPAVKIGYVPIFGPANQDLMGGSYSSGATAWATKRVFMEFNRLTFARDDFDSSISFIPAYPHIDLANGMANGVHPNDTGYQDIADAVYCWIKNNL